jgi:transcriptional regulator with XRE-family HTH domain
MQHPWELQLDQFGDYLREQRRLQNLSLRELAALTNLSNAYISQLERGLHEPSVRVLRSLSAALNISAANMLAQAGLSVEEGNAGPESQTEAAIRADSRLSEPNKQALLSVYRSLVHQS